MPTIAAAPLRRQRLRTAIALATAASAVAAAALFSPRAPQRSWVRAPSSGSTNLTAALVSSHILTGTSDTFVAISLTAPNTVVSRRSPASVAIVFDRSSSMREQPIAQAKAAAIALIDRLGPDDEITLVSYSTHATVDLPLMVADERGRARARAAIAGLEAVGATNLSEGLQLGADELARAHTPLRRVVLISDGSPNEGIYRRDELVRMAATRAANGTSITTVGVGLEFNEAIMTGIAVAGRGGYYFAEDSSALAAMFAAELESLGQTAVVDGRLRITAGPGVEIIDVLGYSFETAADGAVLVPIADLRQNQKTKVVVRVVATVVKPGPVTLAEVTWSYREVGGAARALTASATATATADVRRVEASRDRATTVLVEEARTAIAIDQAAEAYADGEAERATEILDQRAEDSAGLAAQTGDADLAMRIRGATTRVRREFAAAPAPSADNGKRALKGSRSSAYQLAR